jgi:hypothetical protein
MKRKVFALALLLAAWTLPAEASCVTHSYFFNGRMILCTTCCYGTVCNTTCT